MSLLKCSREREVCVCGGFRVDVHFRISKGDDGESGSFEVSMSFSLGAKQYWIPY